MIIETAIMAKVVKITEETIPGIQVLSLGRSSRNRISNFQWLAQKNQIPKFVKLKYKS